MKAFRIFSLVMVVVFAVAAFIPVAAQSTTPQTGTVLVSSPVQAFMNGALGSALLAPMSFPAPFIRMTVESTSADYSCYLVSQTPQDWAKMQRRQYFDMVWNIKNTGKKTWGTSGVDYKYWSGAKLHTKASAFDLPTAVGPGKKIKIVVDMEAPKTKGYYTTVWALVTGKQAFCKMWLSINVNK